ncbi:MAG: 3-deoxy-7-phosphoheptulonate synthase [Candidatus Omnitrophica bacterium]|nr:3-deoxy-7-phosphoheptulonate synthase [Candidatus Omnitrophota bacterium]
MSFEYIQKIPAVDAILEELPLSDDLKAIKAKRDREITSVFKRESDKFILIIGPCSADNEDAVCDYVSRLAGLQERTKERLVLIPRIYTNKPRTTGKGYKGMGHQPVPTEEPNIVRGLKAIRRMHIRSLKESGLTAADEMLYPGNYPYLADLLSYVAIGARSVENQEHRLTVSGLDIPIGMKNPISGDLNVMLNSVEAAQTPHIFCYHDWEVKTSGNPLTHCVMRGAMNQYGRSFPNYHYEDLIVLSNLYLKRDLSNPTIIVDANHSNSNKVYQEQSRIAMEVIHSMRSSELIRNIVKGLMIESYLVEGRQDISGNVYGQSITDSCIGWDDTVKLVLKIADYI